MRLPGRLSKYEAALVWTPEVLAKLGKVSNKIIAELTGLTEQAVSNKRKALGISRPHKSPKWKDEYAEHLGKDTDQKNAELWGVSVLTVRHWRNALKIRPFKIKRQPVF